MVLGLLNTVIPVYSELCYSEYPLIVKPVSPHRLSIYGQIKYVYSEYSGFSERFLPHRLVHYKQEWLCRYFLINLINK